MVRFRRSVEREGVSPVDRQEEIKYSRWVVLQDRNYWECTRCGCLVAEDFLEYHTFNHNKINSVFRTIITAIENLTERKQ